MCPFLGLLKKGKRVGILFLKKIARVRLPETNTFNLSNLGLIILSFFICQHHGSPPTDQPQVASGADQAPAQEVRDRRPESPAQGLQETGPGETLTTPGSRTLPAGRQEILQKQLG